MTLLGIGLHTKQSEVYGDETRFKVVVAGRRWGKCLSGATRVAMADGTYVSIAAIKPGDAVLSVNEDSYRIEPRCVVAVAANGVRDTLCLKTAFRAVTGTPNHPLLVNNRWTEMRDIKAGDLIAVPRRTPEPNDVQDMADHEIDLLAIWLAEGTGNTIANGTPEIIDRLRHATEAFGCTLRQYAPIHWRWEGARTSGRFSAPSAFLRDMGLWGRNSKSKFIPDAIYRLPNHRLARFLNLFMACDGSIARRCKSTWAIEIGLANERMVRQLAELFLRFGIRGQIRHKKHRALDKHGRPYESWRFIVSEASAVASFCVEIGALAKEAQVHEALCASWASLGSCNTYLPISYDDLLPHLVTDRVNRGKYGGYNAKVARGLPDALRDCLKSWQKQDRSRISVRRYAILRSWTDGFFDSLADADLVWEEVVAIETASAVETFDLQIDGNPSFIAEGVVSHNSSLAVAEMLRAARRPNQLVWYVAPTYRMARQIMWNMLKSSIPARWINKSNETTLEFRLKNGSTIALRGADKPDTLRGVGINFLVIDEIQDIKPEVWKVVLRPTLASTRGRGLFIGTPRAYNILYEMWLLGQRSTERKARQWRSWQFPTVTSPFIPVAEIEAAREDMDERSFRQEFEATFQSMSGRVYWAFDRNIHVGEYAFDPRKEIWVGMDFNVDPMSAVILQPQPDGVVWAVDEIHLLSSNTAEVCDELERRYWRQMRHITVFPDPAGAARSHGRGESDLDILRERGFIRLRYRRKHPPVADRINAVNKMLQTANGTVRLRVDARCRHLIKSLEETIYKPGSSVVDKRLGAEHMADAIGYPIEFLFPRRPFKPAGLSI